MGRAVSGRARIVAGVGLALAVLLPAAAQGAVTTGSQTTWPDGGFDVNAQAFNPAVERLDVAYDDTAGGITTSVTLDRPLTSEQYFQVSYALGRPRSGQACEKSDEPTPLVYLSGSVSTGANAYTNATITFDPASDYTGEGQPGSVVATSDRRYEFTVSGQQGLTRQPLKCVTKVEAYGSTQGYEAANFCLGGCPTPPVSDSPPLDQQLAPSRLRASVTGKAATLTWDPSSDPDFSYFAVRRSTRLDTDLATWTPLPGNHTSPTVTDSPGTGIFFYYVTQIDKREKASARSTTLRVEIPSSPLPPPGHQTGSSGSGGSNAGDSRPPLGAPMIISRGPRPVVAAPPSSPGQRSISATQARRQTRTALLLIYRTSFRKAKRFESSCRRNSSTRRTCKVSWRYKRSRYRGRVVVRLSDAGYATTVSVKRSRVR